MKIIVAKLLAFLLPIIFVIIIMPNISFAKTFQVSTKQGFDEALFEAETNQEHDIILLEQNTYTGSFVYSSSEAFNLTIKGGYNSNFSAHSSSPAETTFLDGNFEHSVLVLVCTEHADFKVDGITVKNGQTDNQGGGIYVDTNEGIFTLTNSIIQANTAGDWISGGGGGIYIDSGPSEVNLTNNRISENYGTCGGGIYIPWTIPKITITGNSIDMNTCNIAYKRGGGIFLNSNINGTIQVTGNSIINNEGGGICIQQIHNTTAKLHNNFVCSNNRGSGVEISASKNEINDIFLTNNVVCNNDNASEDSKGAGISLLYISKATLTNNTIASNTSMAEGGGVWSEMYSDDTHLNVYNNIIWNNGSETGSDIFINSDGNNNYVFSEVNLHNNNFNQTENANFFISDPNFYVGIDSSNLNNVNPQFVDASSFNYHLKSTSPCKEKGLNQAPELPSMDIDEEKRIMDGVVEIGADEVTGNINQNIKIMPWMPLLLLDD